LIFNPDQKRNENLEAQQYKKPPNRMDQDRLLKISISDPKNHGQGIQAGKHPLLRFQF
jgi:hypothetical protein